MRLSLYWPDGSQRAVVFDGSRRHGTPLLISAYRMIHGFRLPRRQATALEESGCRSRGTARPSLFVKRVQAKLPGAVSGLELGWSLKLARDQESVAENATDWALRDGLRLEVMGLVEWLLSDLEEAHETRLEAAREVLSEDQELAPGERFEAVEVLAPLLLEDLRRWFSPVQGPAMSIEDLRELVADRLAEAGARALAFKAEEASLPERLWLIEDEDSGLFMLPWALRACAEVVWKRRGRDAWLRYCKNPPALTTEVHERVSRLTATESTKLQKRRQKRQGRLVERSETGVELRDDYGTVARTMAETPIAKLDVIEAGARRLATEVGVRLLVEIVSETARRTYEDQLMAASPHLEYQGFKGLATRSGIVWNRYNEDALRAALEAGRHLEIEEWNGRVLRSVKSLWSYEIRQRKPGFSQHETDLITITPAAALCPRWVFAQPNKQNLLVPVAPLPELYGADKIKPKLANLHWRLAAWLSANSLEILEAGGVKLTDKALKTLADQSGLELKATLSAIQDWSGGAASMLALDPERRVNYADNATYRRFRDFLMEQGRRRSGGLRRGPVPSSGDRPGDRDGRDAGPLFR